MSHARQPAAVLLRVAAVISVALAATTMACGEREEAYEACQGASDAILSCEDADATPIDCSDVKAADHDYYECLRSWGENGCEGEHACQR